MTRPTDAQLVKLLWKVANRPMDAWAYCDEFAAAAEALSQRADPTPEMIERAAETLDHDGWLRISPDRDPDVSQLDVLRSAAETALRAALATM